MEKTKNGTITITNIKWSDIGSWEGVWDNSVKDKKNNYSNHKNLILKNVCNSLIWSSKPEKKIIGINLNDLIIIEEGDISLIMNKNKNNNNEIKKIITELKKKMIHLQKS